MKKVLFIYLILATLLACSGNDDAIETPSPATTLGTLTFSVSGNSGQGTAAQPFTASPGKPLSATLQQNVGYTDGNGRQQTVQPKATIAATVQTDTIRAADLAALTKLTELSPKTATAGNNPKTATRQQIFDIGGQRIAFDLSHEIYSYDAPSGQQTELPYVELKAPKYGAATPDVVSGTRSEQGFGQIPVASVTAIRLTPVGSLTRGTTVRDTTIYDVAVSFTIDATTHNTSSDDTQTLSVDIHYTALVDNVIEVPGASTSLNYELTACKGTTNARSPFSFKPGEPLSLEWTAEARCSYIAASDLSTHVVSRQPKATVAVSVASDTIRYTGFKDSVCVATTVPPAVFTDGQDPQRTVSTQTFQIASQTVSISWTQEDYGSITVEDSTVAMPYLQLEAPELVEVTIQETAQASSSRSRLAGKTYTMTEGQTRADKSSDISNFLGGVVLYEVTARFRQQLKGVNTPNEVAETVEYIVKYVAAVEAKLISTTYEKDYEWFEPWCDLPWRHNYTVHRIRTYSTGEKEIDDFQLPVGSEVSIGGSLYQRGSENNEKQIESLHIIYHNDNYDVGNDDFKFVVTTKTGVSDLSLIGWKLRDDTDTWNTRDFNLYCKVFTTEPFNPAAPEENWYTKTIERARALLIFYIKDEREWVRLLSNNINFGDWFLYLDGKIIDFSEYRMTYDCNIRVDDINFNGAPAKVFTNEMRGTFLGKDFYSALVDTVYQIK